MEEERLKIEGRNAVLEAIRSGKTFEKLLVQKNLREQTIDTIVREARNAGIDVRFEDKERMEHIAETPAFQGVIGYLSAFRYYELDEILEEAKEKGEDPFLILLDGIEDPHNLGAIIRTAHLAGAHGVIIPKNRAVGLTATVAKTSAGALLYTKVCKVVNIGKTIDELKEKGIWFFSADMDGEVMYDCNLRGPIGLVIGNEGSGVSRLVKEKCDFVTSIPMSGKIDSLNASVAAGILMYEVVRQRMKK